MVAYRVEYAKSARAKCVGPICSKLEPKASIAKGEFRFGTWVEIEKLGQASFKWRHYGCITPKILENLKKEYKSLENEFDGYDELTPEDSERIKKAIEEGHLEEGDATPDTRPAKAPKGGDATQATQSSPPESQPAPKKAATKRKAATKKGKEDETEPVVAPVASKKRSAPRKVAKKAKKESSEEEISEAELSDSDEQSAVETEEEEEAPKKKKKTAPKKAPAKKAAPVKKRTKPKAKAEVDSDE